MALLLRLTRLTALTRVFSGGEVDPWANRTPEPYQVSDGAGGWLTFQVSDGTVGWLDYEVAAATHSYVALANLGPGAQAPIAYDPYTDTGYYGEVSAAELITGAALASGIGLSAGVAMSDAGWLKFYVGANADCNRRGTAYVLFISKQPLRRSILRSEIDAASPIDGSGPGLAIGDQSYLVRLLTGATESSVTYPDSSALCSVGAGSGSEWNALLYRAHADQPTCADVAIGMPDWTSDGWHGGPQVGANWDDMTDADLGVLESLVIGSASWCQESIDIGGSDFRIVDRGRYGIAGYSVIDDQINVNLAWRPCLEILQP